MKRQSAQGAVSGSNAVAHDLNTRPRAPRPSIALTQSWHREYLESGAQYRMSFYSYKKGKLRKWRRELNQRKR